MKVHFIILLALPLTFVEASAQGSGPAVSQEGVLDLRDRVLDSLSLVNLKGEWKFFWHRLLTPETLDEEVAEQNGIVVSVPSYWTSYEIGGTPLPGSGFGTYHLTVLLPSGYNRSLCFDIPVFDVAYRFYLNDMLVSENGTVGTSRSEEEPWYEPSRFCYIPDTDTLQLLIQVSNFHHRRGGFWKTMIVGGSEKIRHRWEHRSISNYSTAGILFFFSLFFLVFWLYSRHDIFMLFFALTSLGMLIRSVHTGLHLSNAFVNTPWTWQIRMEYFGTYLAYAFGILFLHRMFPKRYMDIPVRINTGIMILAAASLFLMPPRLFSYEMLGFQPLSVAFLTHYLFVSMKGIPRRKTTHTLFFIALTFFIFTLINDILIAHTARATYNNYLTHLSFQVFIFAMSVMIIIRWVHNYRERIRLESALRFKEKVLSVIAHDLKGPVASIAQFSNLLTEKPELTGKSHIINSLQESSQTAVTLLDNLLYWSRNQADELKVSPSAFPTSAIVNDVVSLFEHMAEQKELDLRSEVEEGTEMYADRSLVEIVLRNLVSNAIKFTPRKGSVSINVKRENSRVVVSVVDTGIGIDPEILKKFRQTGKVGTSAGTEQEKGTGLGLRLVRDLVARNNGELDIESTPGKGSAFRIALPGVSAG